MVTVDQFLDFVGHLLPQEPQFNLPGITGRDLQEVVRTKKSTAGGLDGWAASGSIGCLHCHDPEG